MRGEIVTAGGLKRPTRCRPLAPGERRGRGGQDALGGGGHHQGRRERDQAAGGGPRHGRLLQEVPRGAQLGPRHR